MKLIRCAIFFLWCLEAIRCQQSPSSQGVNNTDFGGAESNGYVVWSPPCRIPHFDPYDKSIKKYIKPDRKPKTCSFLQSLTKVVYNSSTQRHTLQVNSEAVQQYWSTNSSLRCCFSNISGNWGVKDDITDSKYNISKAVCFKNQIELPADAESIFVYCTSKNKKIFKTVYYVTVNKAVDKIPKPVVSKSGPNQKKYSVLLFGIGSVSRSNFVRSFPKSLKYIEKKEWLPLKGYTKVGEDLFSNMVPVLTGMTTDQFTKACLSKKKPKLDNCPFIWKIFSQNGYLTSFTEDSTGSAIFGQKNYGFSKSPTDFYSQPVLSAAENLLRKKGDSKAGDTCLGQHSRLDYLLQFNVEFLQRFHSRPYLNLFWVNAYSRDSEDPEITPSSLDEKTKSFLQAIEPYLNSTVVVFFSDHGRRTGELRRTLLGWLEEQTPFLYFHLPPLLKAAHSNWFQNLLSNRNKLISSFDLHATLQKLALGWASPSFPGCSKCHSLFNPVPQNRSCTEAAIPKAWCPCWSSNRTTSNPPATAVAYEAVSVINKFLEGKVGKLKRGYKCAPLSLSNVTEMKTESVNGTSKSIIAFETTPKAVFEVTVPQNIVKLDKVEDIRRLGKDNDKSSCFKNEPMLKKFCSCAKK